MQPASTAALELSPRGLRRHLMETNTRIQGARWALNTKARLTQGRVLPATSRKLSRHPPQTGQEQTLPSVPTTRDKLRRVKSAGTVRRRAGAATPSSTVQTRRSRPVSSSTHQTKSTLPASVAIRPPQYEPPQRPNKVFRENLHKELLASIAELEAKAAEIQRAEAALNQKLEAIDETRRGTDGDVETMERRARILQNRLKKQEQYRGQVAANNKHLIERIREARKERAVADTLWRNIAKEIYAIGKYARKKQADVQRKLARKENLESQVESLSRKARHTMLAQEHAADPVPEADLPDDDDDDDMSLDKGEGAVTWLTSGFPQETAKAAFMVRHIRGSYDSLAAPTALTAPSPPKELLSPPSPGKKAMWYGLRTSLQSADGRTDVPVYAGPPGTPPTKGKPSPIRTPAQDAAPAASSPSKPGTLTVDTGTWPADIPRLRGSVTELLKDGQGDEEERHNARKAAALWNVLAGVVGFMPDASTTESTKKSVELKVPAAASEAGWETTPEAEHARNCKAALEAMCAKEGLSLDELVEAVSESDEKAMRELEYTNRCAEEVIQAEQANSALRDRIATVRLATSESKLLQGASKAATKRLGKDLRAAGSKLRHTASALQHKTDALNNMVDMLGALSRQQILDFADSLMRAKHPMSFNARSPIAGRPQSPMAAPPSPMAGSMRPAALSAAAAAPFDAILTSSDALKAADDPAVRAEAIPGHLRILEELYAALAKARPSAPPLTAGTLLPTRLGSTLDRRVDVLSSTVRAELEENDADDEWPIASATMRTTLRKVAGSGPKEA